MGTFIDSTELVVGDVFRVIGHLGAVGKPRQVAAVRILVTSTRYVVIEADDAAGNRSDLNIQGGVSVEKLHEVTGGVAEVADMIDLIEDGESILITRYLGRIYA